MEEAFEVVIGGFGDAKVMLTCEHAAERMPSGFSWDPADAWLRGTHWTHDLGAANLTRELAGLWGATAILSRFTRLLADPNRPEEHPDLFRMTAEGRPVQMNQRLDEAERERRLSRLYRPYHAEVDTRIRSSSAEILFAVHSYTPVYEGQRRELEVGVLFDVDEALAERVRARLERAGMRAALNEPYSGKEGLMYSADRHASAHDKKAVELEVRQDLLVDPMFRERLADALTDAFF
jgi:predicted N-formylglutamate amidohydrolase